MTAANPWRAPWLHYAHATLALVAARAQQAPSAVVAARESLDGATTRIAQMIGGDLGHRFEAAARRYTQATDALVASFVSSSDDLDSRQRAWTAAARECACVLASMVKQRSLTTARARLHSVSTPDGCYDEWFERIQVLTLDAAIAREALHYERTFEAERALLEHASTTVADGIESVCAPMNSQARELLDLARSYVSGGGRRHVVDTASRA